MTHEDPLSPFPFHHLAVETLPKDHPYPRCRRIPSALIPTDSSPYTYHANPHILARPDIAEIYNILTDDDPVRLGILEQVASSNKALFPKVSTIGVYLDGRSIKEKDKTYKKQTGKSEYEITRDGFWGDATEAARIIPILLAEGKRVVIFSSQPTFFSKAKDDAMTYVQIPDSIIPFQFYPYYAPTHRELVELFHQHRTPGMAMLAPLNSRFPVLFTTQERDGLVDLSQETHLTAQLLREAAFGNREIPFSGITMSDWKQICHQSQALQVMVELLGIDTSHWQEFPQSSIHPPATARILANEYTKNFAPDAVNALFHIGTATNYRKKEHKSYPLERWNQILTLIAAQRPDLVGTIILFQPINPDQARKTLQIANHAREVLGAEKVVVLPLKRDWNLSAFTAFMDELADKGILVCVDSGPSHIGRARGIPTLVVGNNQFPQDFYAPPGAMVVLPTGGKDAAHVRPEDVAHTFITMAERIF